MAKPARQALPNANEKTGCIVCEAWNDEMVTVVDHSARICPACVIRVGRAILSTNPAVVAQLWPASPPIREGSREGLPRAEVDVDELLEAFKVGVAKQISADDAQHHFDLAVVYDEMGLTADAIREAATTLRARASSDRNPGAELALLAETSPPGRLPLDRRGPPPKLIGGRRTKPARLAAEPPRS